MKDEIGRNGLPKQWIRGNMTKNITGRFGDAIIYTDLVEDDAVEQVRSLLDMPYAKGANVRMMPDIHAGAGCTIGTTMHIKDKICPNLVGVDIGCGMLVAKMGKLDIDPEKVQKIISKDIPSGRNIRANTKIFDRMSENSGFTLDGLRCNADIDRAKRSVGTLGGGNHFIEIDRDDDGCMYIVIHSGSRHLGVEVADHYQKKAIERKNVSKEDRDAVIKKCKAEGHPQTIEEDLRSLTGHFSDVPDALMWLEGDDMGDYLNDMGIAQDFATMNRQAMLECLLSDLGIEPIETFTTRHNYIDLENMILRKGAVRADKGEMLIIPMNMRDGSLICTGKGNPEWNSSAPHGAGRLMSRSQAKKSFTLDEFRDSMQNVASWSVCIDTIDECPMAYKPMQSILDNIGDTVDVVTVIKPVYNFKAKE